MPQGKKTKVAVSDSVQHLYSEFCQSLYGRKNVGSLNGLSLDERLNKLTQKERIFFLKKAIFRGHSEILEALERMSLLPKGAYSTDVERVVEVSAARGDLHILEILMRTGCVSRKLFEEKGVSLFEKAIKAFLGDGLNQVVYDDISIGLIACAASGGFRDVYLFLIECDSISLASFDPKSVLMLAAAGGDVYIVQSVLHSFEDVASAKSEIMSAVEYALANGFQQVVSFLLSEKCSDGSFFFDSKQSSSLLFVAAKYNYLELVEKLIERASELGLGRVSLSSALSVALDHGCLDVVKCFSQLDVVSFLFSGHAEKMISNAKANGHLDLEDWLIQTCRTLEPIDEDLETGSDDTVSVSEFQGEASSSSGRIVDASHSISGKTSPPDEGSTSSSNRVSPSHFFQSASTREKTVNFVNEESGFVCRAGN